MHATCMEAGVSSTCWGMAVACGRLLARLLRRCCAAGPRHSEGASAKQPFAAASWLQLRCHSLGAAHGAGALGREEPYPGQGEVVGAWWWWWLHGPPPQCSGLLPCNTQPAAPIARQAASRPLMLQAPACLRPVQVVGCVGWSNERLLIPESLKPEYRQLLARCFADQGQRPSFRCGTA